MKTITSNVDRSLPLPDGRMLVARTSIAVSDVVAASERVQGWASSQAVTVVDYVERQPTPPAESASGESSSRGKKGSRA